MSLTLPDIPNTIFRDYIKKHCHTNRPFRVIGEVDLDGAELPRSLTLSGILFEDRLRLRCCHIRGTLAFEDCTFNAGIDLAHACIDESLVLRGGRIGCRGLDDTDPSLALDHARIAGLLEVSWTELRSANGPCISVRGTRVEGECRFGSIEVARNRSSEDLPLIDLSALRCDSLIFAPPRQRGLPFEKRAARRTSQIAGNVRAIGVCCASRLSLSHLDGQGLAFSQSRIGKIEMANLTVADIALDGVDCHSLSIRDSRLRNVLRLDSLTCATTLTIRHIRGHDEKVDRPSAGQRPADGQAASRRAFTSANGIQGIGITCTGRLSLADCAARMIDISRSRIGPVDMEQVCAADILAVGSECSDFSIRDCFITADLQLGGLQCNGFLAIEGAGGRRFHDQQPDDPCDVDNMYIRGKLDLWSVRVGIDLHLTSADVRQRVWIGSADIGNLFIAGEPGKPVRLGALLIDHTRVKGDVTIAQVEVVKQQTIWFAGLLRLLFCRIGGSVRLWRSHVMAQKDGNEESKSVGWAETGAQTSVAHGLEIVRCTVDGNVVLTRVVVGTDAPDRSEPCRLTLDFSEIGSKLIFSSPEGVLADPDARPLEKQAARDLLQDGARMPIVRCDYAAVADAVSMQGLRVRGADLSGLWLRQGGAPHGSGTVEASGVRITEALELHVRGEEGPCCAQIPGSLRLDGAQIGTLVVAADSFLGQEADGSGPARLVLRDAQIDRLEIAKRGRAGRHGNGLPSPLDLTNARILGYDFAFMRDSDFQIADVHLDLLDNDARISRSVYRDLVRRLRDEGRIDAALRIHYAEHFRAFWEPRRRWRKGHGRIRPPLSALLSRSRARANARIDAGLQALMRVGGRPPVNPPRLMAAVPDRQPQPARLRWLLDPREVLERLWDPVNRMLLRYGASPLPLFVCILLLGLASLLVVAADARNFELSTANRMLISAARASGQDLAAANLVRDTRPCDDGQVLAPRPESWSWLDAGWITFRYHVPVISAFAREDVVPTDDRGIIPAIRPLAELSGARHAGTGPQPAAFWTQTADGYVTCTGPTAGTRSLSEGVLFTPEDWFQAMAIMNWIMWPLLLTALLRRVLKDER